MPHRAERRQAGRWPHMPPHGDRTKMKPTSRLARPIGAAPRSAAGARAEAIMLVLHATSAAPIGRRPARGA